MAKATEKKQTIVQKMKAAKGKRVLIKFKDGDKIEFQLNDVFKSVARPCWVALVDNGMCQSIDILGKIADVTVIREKK